MLNIIYIQIVFALNRILRQQPTESVVWINECDKWLQQLVGHYIMLSVYEIDFFIAFVFFICPSSPDFQFSNQSYGLIRLNTRKTHPLQTHKKSQNSKYANINYTKLTLRCILFSEPSLLLSLPSFKNMQTKKHLMN